MLVLTLDDHEYMVSISLKTDAVAISLKTDAVV